MNRNTFAGAGPAKVHYLEMNRERPGNTTFAKQLRDLMKQHTIVTSEQAAELHEMIPGFAPWPFRTSEAA